MSTSTPDFVDPYKKIWESRDLNSLNSTPVELENNRSQFRRGLGAFGDEMQATGYGLAALGAQGVENIVGKNDITSGIRDWGLEGYNRNIAESQGGLNTPNVARVEDIKNASDAMDWASYQLGKGLPMLGSLALSGGIGGAIARIGAKQGVSAIAKSAVGSAVKEGVEAGTLKAVEGQVVTQGMKDAAAKLIRDRVEKGVLAGGFTGSFGLEGGQAFGEEVAAGAKPEDAVLSATAVGGINGLLEFLPLYKVAKDIGLGHYAKKKLAAEIMDDPSLAKKAIDLAGRVGKSGLQGAAEGAAIEGVTEGLQELVSAVGQRWATKEPLFADLNSDDWSRIGNAALAGGLVGGVAAGAGHAAGGLVSPQVKITNNQKENTTQAAEQPTLTRTQVLEAMRDKANSDIELATKVNDTAKVEELTKARDIYEEKLNEIKNNEQVLAEQPIIDNTQVSPETTPIKEDQQPASEDIFNKGFNELNTKVDNSQNIIEPKTSEVSGKQAGEDLSSEITTQPQLEQSHEERQAEVASLLSQEGDVTEANVPDVTSTPTNKVLLSQNISENDAEQEQLWKEFQAVKAQFEAKQSDKPAFDKWFGEGVEGVNKKDGKPVELYHGTNNPMFYQWDESRAGQSSSHPTSGLGFFMTADKGSAARYGSDLLKLHVKVEKPYYMTDTDLTSIESVQDATKFRENLKSQGYDSAVITAPGASPYVVAFNSNQVKLSDNTNPTSSPDFRYSRPQKEIKPTSITEVADKEYLDAIKSGDLAFAQKMVQKAAQEAGVPIINDNDVTSYKIRRSAPPVKTIKAYKLFRTKVRTPGEVFPLFVGANTPLPQGVWLDAVPGESAPNSKTGKQKVKSSLGPLAYRPGWHAGDLPLATHIGAKDANGNIVGRKLDEVWVEVEMAADKDYQPEANKNGVTVNGEFSPALADIKTMPTDGLYRYKTNPNMTGQWIISGSMKINRALSEDEVNKILTENNLKPMPWVQQQKGSKTWTNSVLNLNRLGLTNNPAINQKKLLDTITYDDNGNIIPLSKRFNPKITDPRYSNLVEKNNQNRFIDAEYNINSKLGDGWLQRAQDLGLVEVNEGPGPNNEAGSWDGNKIRMYLGSISEDSSPLGILLHEGKHATFKDVLGDSLESYVKDLQTIANTGNQSAQSAIKHAALAAAKTLGIKHDLTMGSRLADFNNIRALIEEKNPGLLSEEELAYFIQYGTETQSGRGFIRRLIEQIKAWFAQTEIGKKFKEAGLGFELNEAMAIEWAKEGLKQATNKLEQSTKEVNKTKKQLVKSPASVRVGDIVERINKANSIYSTNTLQDDEILALDKKYITAISQGNIKEAEALIKIAAEKAGYTTKAYHGTPADQFNVFDIEKLGENTGNPGLYGAGFYFTENQRGAASYGNRIVSAYLRLNNPLVVESMEAHESSSNTTDEEFDAAAKINYNAVSKLIDTYPGWTVEQKKTAREKIAELEAIQSEGSLFEVFSSVLEAVIRKKFPIEEIPMELTRVAKEAGFDSIKVNYKNTLDEIVVFAPNQIKSTEITRDSSGNVIPLSQRFNEANSSILYSTNLQGIKNKLWTDPTDINQDLVNKPGLIQRLQADFVDYFSHIEKKAPELYDTYSLMRNKKGARIEQARQEYIEPLRQLIVNSPWTAAEVGDMLAARHIKLDSVNQNLAERASYDYTGKLLASLPKKEKAELKEARAFVKEGKMLDGKDYVDNKGNKIDMPEEVKRKMMFDLMNKYAPFEAKDSNGNQPITADWEIFKDAASGFSEGGIGKDRVRAVDDVLKRTSENQAQFDKIANMFDAANRAVLDILEYGGLITKSEHARLLADKSAYAPLRRSSYNIDSSIEQLLQNRGQGAGKSLGTRVGTSELSEPTLVVQNAMAKLGAAIASAEKNMANNELYDTIMSDREGWKSWFTTNDKDTFATHDSDGFSHESKSSNLNPTDVVLIKNGKRLIIQPNMHNERAIGFVRAINNLDAQALNGPMKVLGWTNQLVRWVNVNASPAFLMMNAIRDPFTAAYNLQASEAAPYTAEIFGNYGASFRALKKVFLDGNRDQTDPDVRMVEKWENAGGRTSMIHDLKPMDESWRSFDAQVARRQGNMKQLMQVKDKWINGLENFNLLFENVMRLSAFNTLVEKGVVSEKRAARIAQDLTTNFTRRGYKSQALGTWWLFFNATVQGNYQVLRNIISSKKVQIAAGGTIAFSLMMDILGRTLYPDDWDKRPEWDKERYITLPFKAYGDFLKIPAPWVYNVVWRLGSSIGEMQAGVIKPQDAMLDLAAMTLSTLSPVSGGSFLQRIAPTVADPFVQIAENKDFSGNPIGPEGYPGAGSKANSELLWNSTPRGYQEFARMINRATGGDEVTSGKLDLRPGDYQVLARFLTGSLGRFLSDSTFGFKDAINRGIEGPKDIPVVRELFSDPYNPMRSEKYHNNIASVYGAHKLENMYRAGPDRDLVKLHEVRTEKRVELSMFNQAKDVEKQIKSLRTQIRVAENRGDTERVKVLKDRMGQVQERFNKSFRSKMG